MSMERLFAPERYREHEEMYLKAIWRFEELRESPAHVTSISRLLKVKPPSVVGMLKKLNSQRLITYSGRQGTVLTSQGRQKARHLIRNCRLVEVFMHDGLGIAVDEKVACSIEHRLTEEFADALCKMLHHPISCPHSQPIPRGKCCQSTDAF